MRQYAGPAGTVVALGLLALGSAACGGGPADVEDDADELVGTWVSAGSDLAPGLLVGPFVTDSIIGTFREDGTYGMVQWVAGAEVNRVGTYTTGPEPEGAIRALTLVQTSPAELTFAGIFQVGEASMRYEIIQVEPPLSNVQPASVARGFGSTRVNSIFTGTTWIQDHVRRD